jgi:RNA polymerase-binding transcription factor DksA
MTQEKTRFTDSELAEFKELIQNKLKEAQIDFDLLLGSLSHNDDHGTDDTGRTFNMMEDGSETLSREEMSQLAARQEKLFQSLQAALIRIENKTYGICRVTGKLIAKERLRLVPHATMSIEAKNAQNN